jgi:hypothetical protein
MSRKGWWSQRFAPEGSVAGEGIVRQLGLPQLDPLTILVREAAQNSWDASRGDGPVQFSIRLQKLGASAPAWRDELLPGPEHESKVTLAEALTEDSVMVFVSDRNTVGLGGPTRAGTRPAPGETPNFVQFIRDVGEARDKEYGGGTYGFGKGIFHRLSRPGTIVVDTQTVGPNVNRRLIGAALGDSYYIGDQRYTGRHWWGVETDSIADPFEGDRAALVATNLGFPAFAEGSSGTSIAIIGAKLGYTSDGETDCERSIDDAAEFIASSVLWHLWPKFIPDDAGQYMQFHIYVNDREFDLPSPEDLDEFKPFVESLRDVRKGQGTPYVRTVAPKRAGTVAVSLTASSASSTSPLVNLARPFTGPPHHVARMRNVELVVDYLTCPPGSDMRFAYGGVFKSSLEADFAFAAAEPPTHDSWIAGGLSGAAKGVVQNLNRFLLRAVDERMNPHRDVPQGDASQGLGKLSARLGSLIPGVGASDYSRTGKHAGAADDLRGRNGAGVGDASQSRGVGSSNTKSSRPRIVEQPRLEIHGEGLRFVARVLIPGSRSPRSVRAAIDVVLDGGQTEGESPEGADVPKIVEWKLAGGAEIIEGSDLLLPAGEAAEWYVHASYVDNAVVRFRVGNIDGGRHAQ